VAVTVLVGQRAVEKDRLPAVWMAILVLATLRSPFLPIAYGAIPSLWLLTLMAARVAPSGRILVAVCALCALLNFYWPTDWILDPRIVGLALFAPQAITAGLAAVALRRARGTVATV